MESKAQVFHCLFDSLVSPRTLKPHPKNRNKHSREQIERYAKVIGYQGWRWAIKISKRSGFITSGHGRCETALFKHWEFVPVVYQDYDSEEQEIADVNADNALARWAEFDLEGINRFDLPDLGPNFDIDMLGIKSFVLEPAEKYADKEPKKIKCPECDHEFIPQKR